MRTNHVLFVEKNFILNPKPYTLNPKFQQFFSYLKKNHYFTKVNLELLGDERRPQVGSKQGHFTKNTSR
jgi:hypothetical protein